MRWFPILLCGALGLAACDTSVKAPTETGVCWHAVQGKDGKIHFNRLQDRVQSIEYCAAALERMRIRFLGLGGTASDLTGAYQGQYLFVQKEGVMTSKSLNGTPFTLLVRTGDGRLAVPGAMPQESTAPAAPTSHTIEVPPLPPQR